MTRNFTACLCYALIASAAMLPAVAQAGNLTATVPFTVVNNSGTGQDVYISVVGMLNNTWYYMTDTNGDVAAVTYTSGMSSYGFNLGSAAKTTLQLPALIGARIYVSLGAPLMVTTSTAGVPGSPAGWVSTDPSYKIPFDWAEYTWTSGSGTSTIGGNLTQVDMFGLALTFKYTGTVNGKTSTVTSGFNTAAGTKVRKQLLAAMAKAPSPWNALVINGSNGQPLRAMSPYHGIENNVFPSTELDSYIAAGFAKYKSGGLSATVAGTSFTGTTQSGEIVFTDAAGDSFQFPQMTTYQTYTGAIVPVPVPSNAIVAQDAYAVGALLQGALMRTVLNGQGNLNACDVSTFYHAQPVNHYAQIIHAHALNHLAYGFGYDDTCNQSSYIQMQQLQSVELDIGPF